MNHFPLLKILYLSTSTDSYSSGHPDLQNYVPQKPARRRGNELVRGIEDSEKKLKSDILLHSILNSKCGFSPEDFFHILSKRPTNGCQQLNEYTFCLSNEKKH
jgi:hypothetical protein